MAVDGSQPVLENVNRAHCHSLSLSGALIAASHTLSICGRMFHGTIYVTATEAVITQNGGSKFQWKYEKHTNACRV